MIEQNPPGTLARPWGPPQPTRARGPFLHRFGSLDRPPAPASVEGQCRRRMPVFFSLPDQLFLACCCWPAAAGLLLACCNGCRFRTCCKKNRNTTKQGVFDGDAPNTLQNKGFLSRGNTGKPRFCRLNTPKNRLWKTILSCRKAYKTRCF